MADSDRNGIPNGLNRIRTRPVLPEDQSSSGGDESPATAAPPSVNNGKIVDDQKGFRKGRKIARWLSSHLNPKDSYRVDKVSSNIEKQSKMASLGFKHSMGESSTVTKTSQKSFSHELGPRGGIRASNLRARSYTDLKELLGSLHSKFDVVKEAVNAELDAFAGDVSDAIEKGSLSKEQETAENLLSLSYTCTEMTPSQLKENCESIVHHLAARRAQCKSGLVKQFLTRLLFILTRCTRLLQFQKDSGPNNEESLVRFKQCLENVPVVDMKWSHKLIKSVGHKTIKSDFSINSIVQDNLQKHFLEDNSKVDKEVLPSIAGDHILHEPQTEGGIQEHALCESSLGSQNEQEESSDGTPIDSVICRICEEDVPASHLESHSYICAYADKCDLEGLDVDERLLNISEILEQIVESYNQSWHAASSIPEISRIQSVNSVHGSEGHSPKLQEWHNKGMEGMFEDIHEMDTACIDDPQIAAFNNLKSILAMKLGSCNPNSSNGSMTPGSSTTTPRSSQFDLFWLEHTSPSEPEDVNQMNELADICRRVAQADLSKEGACEYLEMCLCDLLDILQHNQLKALVIDTFGSHIKYLLEEKHQLCIELMGKQSKNKLSRLDKTEGSDFKNPSQRKTLDPSRSLHKERTSINDFEMIKPISRGAFGEVFLARKRTTGDVFAIKVLKKLDMIRKNDIERILAERNILITVRNPFVVRFFYSFTCRENLYLVMEYLNGGDLYSLLKNVGCLEEDVVRIYVAELVLALEYLHSLGITHRDLKPDNILIARDGHIKLTDFGLSKIGLIDSAVELSGCGTADSVLLESQNFHKCQRGEKSRSSAVGTPDYLAPEILLGTAHGYAADWWSVGIILFEFITGIPPFTARLPEMIFDNILNRKIPWPRAPDDMSDEAKDLIDRFLDPDQDLRLGANGASEVKSHPFFKEIDWDNLALQKAAFIPQPDSVDDTSYFMSRPSSISPEVPVDDSSSDCGSDATKSSSTTVTEINIDEYSELKEFDSRTSLDLSSINFSFKNVSQLASMNYDVLLQSGRNSKCSSPSQAPSS